MKKHPQSAFRSLFYLLSFFIIIVAIAAGFRHYGKKEVTMLGTIDAQCKRPFPFLIAPMIGGIGKPETKIALGDTNQPDSKAMLNKMLDEIEPGGPHGQVELGYTMPIPLWSLVQLKNGSWAIDEANMELYLDLLRHVDRPTVVSLTSNHFATDTPMMRQLIDDPINMMQLPDGTVPLSLYFETFVIPFSLSIDPQLPVNQVRFALLDRIMAELIDIDKKYPERIRAVTINGEVHHLTANLAKNNGVFTPYAVTDFSPLAVREFRAWVKNRYQGSLDAFNHDAKTNFPSWDAIDVPRKNIRSDKLTAFWEHIDSYAHGMVPVFGWLDTALPIDKIEIWVDGEHLMEAERGLDRLDVYESVATIHDANTGFRAFLDVSNWPRGQHRLQVLAYPSGKTPFIIGERTIVIMGQSQEPVPDLQKIDRFSELPRDNETFRSWLDHPQHLIDIYYNPLARLWQEFREYQVEAYLRTIWRKAIESGFDARRLYSHQFLPDMEASWNTVALASNLTQLPDSPYQKGITLYGGQSRSEKVLQRIGSGPYGVPEFNPLQNKSPLEPWQALDFHRQHCAEFVTPYFMTIDLTYKHMESSEHNEMQIAPSAPKQGGIDMFEAIKKIVNE